MAAPCTNNKLSISVFTNAGTTMSGHQRAQSCIKVGWILRFSPLVSGLYMLLKKNVYMVLTDKRRACFKGRFPGTSVNLKKYVDLEKDHMEKFLRLRSFMLFKQTLLQC